MPTIPRVDSQFMAFARNLQEQCAANAAAWNLDAAVLAEFERLTDNAAAAYEANLNPQTKCHATSENKKAAFAALKHYLSMVVGALRYNSAVPDEALTAMGLPSRVHHAHQPIPVPTDTPEVVVRAGVHGEVSVYVDTPSFGQPDRSISRERYHGFMLRWRFTDDTDWHTEVSTRLHITLLFENEDTGKTLSLQAAWVNPRMQNGPWSAEITALVN